MHPSLFLQVVLVAELPLPLGYRMAGFVRRSALCPASRPMQHTSASMEA